MNSRRECFVEADLGCEVTPSSGSDAEASAEDDPAADTSGPDKEAAAALAGLAGTGAAVSALSTAGGVCASGACVTLDPATHASLDTREDGR